jgi:cation transport protein ChaC
MDMWVFGYGSLLWNPGFEYVETALARLDGYQRSFCMRSIHHRGTVEHPGLVLALDQTPIGSCDGLAFRVPKAAEAATLAYLRERELISSAYLEKTVTITLRSGQTLPALTYVIDPEHVQYCGSLPLAEQAQIIAAAIGGMGPNSEYLFNTVTQITKLGLKDADLQWLATQVRTLHDEALGSGADAL